MTANIQQNFLTLKTGQQLHYHCIGTGPALLMLHPSPQNGEALLPAAAFFSKRCTCIVLDTPGYGLSEPLNIENPDIDSYADCVIDAATALGLDRFCLYGAATGSQIAIQVAKRFPDRVAFLMLDSNGHVSDDEREQMLDGYFPDVTPTHGGGHLLTYWEMCRNLFIAFPWTSGRREDRLNIPAPSPEIVQTILMRYLQAGEKYDLAYRMAFEIENARHLDGLDTPSIMTRWANSPVVKIADALIEQGLPECVEVLRANGGLSERYKVQGDALAKILPSLKLEVFEHMPVNNWGGSKLHSAFLAGTEGPLHVRLNLGGDGPALVCLHDACRSLNQLETLVRLLVGKRPVILVDLPGHGASMKPRQPPTLETLAGGIETVLRSLDITRAEVLGSGLGVAVGATLSSKMNVRHVYNLDDQFRVDISQLNFPDSTPVWEGTHLTNAWNLVRDLELNKLEDADLSPATLHQKTKELLIVGQHFKAFYEFAYSLNITGLTKNMECPFSNLPPSEIMQSLMPI